MDSNFFGNLPLHPNSPLPSVQSCTPSPFQLNGIQGEVTLQSSSSSQTHKPDVQ